MLRVPQPRLRQRVDLLSLLPSAVLGALGALLLGERRSLWYDELFTAQVAPVPLRRLAQAVLSGEGTEPYLADIPPSYNAPYYVVVHGWLALTRQAPGEISLRSLSLLASVLAVGVLTLVVTRLADRRAGLAAGLVAATNPLVLEYAVEARGYGLAMLATAVTALGLVRWLDGGRLLLYAAGAAGAGLAHWFALPVVAGLAAAALLLRRRRALPLLGVTALAVLPAVALVALALAGDDGSRTTAWIGDTGGRVPWLSLQAWTAGSRWLLVATLVAAALAVRTRSRAAVVGACWVLVPLLLITGVELVRPVYVPRYLLPALLGLAVLAGVGLAGRWRGVGAAALVALSLLACLPLAGAPPRDDARGAVQALAGAHVPGQPVVAVDQRAALALEQYAPRALRPDLRFPPDDPPPAADVVWLVRYKSYLRPLRRTDDDDVLRAAGLQVVEERAYDGSNMQVLVQRWARP